MNSKLTVFIRCFFVAMIMASVNVMESIASDVYRWVDDNGEVHYGERPPVNQEAERLDLHYTTSDPEAATEQAEQIDEANKARQEAEEKQRKEREQAQRQARIRQQNCDNARKNIRALSGNTSTKYRQEDGSYSRYSGEEHQANLDAARKAEREYCYGS